MVDKKAVALEADAYFTRNRNAIEKGACSSGMKYFCQMYEDYRDTVRIDKVLEIGCNTGYNLSFLNENYGMACYGIDPSEEAVKYGNLCAQESGQKVELRQGFSDSLPYEDKFFDMIYFGFCLYSISRELLFRTLSEGDRVLKNGGLCVITDFDTPVLYSRENIHNKSMSNYKTDYARNLEPFGYTLLSKKMYAHAPKKTIRDVQERVSTQIFYKENTGDLYLKG